jgi:hypothetical protein
MNIDFLGHSVFGEDDFFLIDSEQDIFLCELEIASRKDILLNVKNSKPETCILDPKTSKQCHSEYTRQYCTEI